MVITIFFPNREILLQKIIVVAVSVNLVQFLLNAVKPIKIKHIRINMPG